MTCKDCGWKSVKWKSLNPSGVILFCEYSDERTWEDECCCAWKPISIGITPYTDEDWKKTNADRIRALSDEKLAEYLFIITCEDGFPQFTTKNDWLSWLKREVE